MVIESGTIWKLRDVSYSPSIVIMAVCLAISEIFSVKEWRDLKNQVRGRSRSLKMAQFDRPYATFYSSAFVNIALSCTIFVTLKSGLEVTQGHWNWCHSKAWVQFPIPFYSNCGRICSRLWDIHYTVSKNGVRYTIWDFLLVSHCKYSSILYHFRVIWRFE